MGARARLSPLAGRGFRSKIETSGAKRSGGEGHRRISRTARRRAPLSASPPHPRLLRRLAAFASRVFPACAPKNGPRVDPRSGSPLPAGGERGVTLRLALQADEAADDSIRKQRALAGC